MRRDVPAPARGRRALGGLRLVTAMLGSVGTSMIQPFEISGEVAGVAFDCGIGASTNWIYSGRDVSGRVVCLLADLDLLTDADLSSA